ncbi:LuxR family transcriptional regulator [Nocardioides panaciterrulae]|uniref:ATP/maltotriose-dependent transcriptional regulator MalT n=1 Tax=Nocardioides panaciterrulae TaxID=661492 RepID=A0A7Y9E791_9ACTN|nr:LuxR family transcriptional regulator [Nocardioides panaciterrulae]NYD42230.1 ATP/maltotriose-dependent transcriptional regulator MalT [Nocardioides panaciterrulae]
MSSLETAQEALAAGSWSRADSAFRAAIEEDADPRAYEGLAQAGWWLDDAPTCLGARESAYRRYRELGDPVGAGRVATALAWDCLLFGLGESVALGWLGRARDLLEGVEERPEHGWCWVREAELALSVRKDPARALECAVRATGVGRHTGDDDLTVVGLALQGLALTRRGEVEAGMSRLDSAAAAVTAGDVADLMWMGKVLCWLIAACHEAQDVTRAGEWCRRVEAICRDRDLVPLLHVCRITYASVQVAGGTWVEAERELTRTVSSLGASSRASRVEAVVQLGELRRRQGRLAEAEALFAQAEFHPVAVVGRALVKFATGDAAGAWSSLQRLLRALPPENRLARADVLLPAVRVAHALGEGEAARVAADELRQTAAAVRTDALVAMSATADAVLAGPEEAPVLLHEAVRRYHRAGLRHDEAAARLALAASLHATGDEAGAQEQLDTATACLAELADEVGLAEARRIAGSLHPRSAHPLTPREVEVLGLVARGLSNDEIATALTLSSHTVHRHVANILTKLDQPTRTGAVSHALGAGLL